MGIQNEKTFSDAEMIAAYSLLLPPQAAEEEALAMNSLPDLRLDGDATGDDLRAAAAGGPRSYDDDILDLLSMVSHEAALKAWRLLGVSPEEGRRRRETFRVRVEAALRRDPRADW
jgi:hypothetical protein